jgi:hypothetical protein
LSIFVMSGPVFHNPDRWHIFKFHMGQDETYIYQKIPNLFYKCVAFLSQHYIEPQNSDWFQWGKCWSFIHQNPVFQASLDEKHTFGHVKYETRLVITFTRKCMFNKRELSIWGGPPFF